MLCRKEGGTKVALSGVRAGGRDPWPATMQPDMGGVVCGGNFMSTLELVPSVNATRLLRTVYGINTPVVAPTFHQEAECSGRKWSHLTQKVGLLGLGRVSVASKSQQGIESPVPLASRACSFWASEFNHILGDHLLFSH